MVLVLLDGDAALGGRKWARDRFPAIVGPGTGQPGGTAIADVLFGDYNPGRRLPVTFYKSTEQLPPFEDYDMRAAQPSLPGRAFVPLRIGLSYTRFTYRLLRRAKTASAKREARVQWKVLNAGKLAARKWSSSI